MATIKKNESFSAETSAKALKKAMKGLGTDEACIIDVLSTHTWEQRNDIARYYETSYGKSLVKELKSNNRGKFLDTILGLMNSTAVFLAKDLRSAIKGPGTDENVLIEILCPRTNDEINSIKAAYTSEYGRDLVADVSGDTRGDFKRLLISQLSGNRDEVMIVELSKAEEDAKNIFEAGEGQFGTDESVFNQILCTRSFPQLCATFEQYKQNTGHDIETAIRKETRGNIKAGYLAIVSYAQDAAAFFAYRLYKSMRGLGTDDDTLIRIVVTRSEIDLLDISVSFHTQFKDSLSGFIKSDCRGDYKKLLLAIVGER